MKAPKEPEPNKLAFTIDEAAKSSTLGLTSIYRAIRDKKLIARKYGTRTIITRDELAEFLRNLPPAEIRLRG